MRFAPDCPGTYPLQDHQSEDCLYLNVWSKDVGGSARSAKLPVMVWLYGGAFRGGSAANPMFDGAALARRGVILVSPGFRVGPLGYLATPELSAASPHRASGNYGILDAIAALRWVRQNIAAFGGDPDKVTVFGQSSGSETVNILTASPLAKGLFQRAIGESGSSLGMRRALPLAEAERGGERFMHEHAAADLAALRALPLDAVLAKQDEKFEPNIDGWVLPEDGYALYRAGRQNDVPMLVGSNGQEMPSPEAVTPAEFQHSLEQALGPLAGKAEPLFDAHDDAGAAKAQSWLTDILWGDFPAATWTQLQAASGRAPIYRYLFDYAPPPPPGRSRRAFHGAELGYVFGTYRRPGAPPSGPADDRMALLVSSYWVNFARNGNPNGPGLPYWPPASRQAGMVMRFDDAGAAPAAMRAPELVKLLRDRFYGPDDQKKGDQRRLAK